MSTLEDTLAPVAFRLPLPPPTNSGYKIGVRHNRYGWHAQMMKTDRLIAWEREAQYIINGWLPPAKTPLAVKIVMGLPAKELRRTDVDGRHKFLIDQVIGKRRDQWVDRLEVSKVEGDGYAVVTVELLIERALGGTGC